MVRGASLFHVQEKEKAFRENEFNSWKKANKKFKENTNSGMHRAAIEQLKLQNPNALLDAQTAAKELEDAAETTEQNKDASQTGPGTERP